MSKTSVWAAAKYNSKCQKLKDRKLEQPGLSCSTYVLYKNCYVSRDSTKMVMFRPTRPKLAMFRPTRPWEKCARLY